MSLSVNFPAMRPTLNLNFARARQLDPRITFTRASTATYFDSSGVLQTAIAGQPRFDFSPTTGESLGLLIEEQRTNSIRNNTMQGAVAGTPGTLPTNWIESSIGTGLTRQVVGTGTSNGITYIDIKVSGTTSIALGWSIFTDANTQIAASSGQTWTGSAYIAIVGGSTANMTSPFMRVVERNSGGSYVTESNASWGSATSTLVNNRFTLSRTLGETAAFVQFGIYFNAASGVAIDITLRIGLPQLELGAFATSVIPTTVAAATRNADVATMTGTNFSSWFNNAEGSFYTESQILYNTGASTFPGVFSVNSGVSTNQILSYLSLNSTRQHFYVRVLGTVVVDIFTTSTANSVFKSTGAYKENDFATSLNGATVATDTSGTLPAGIDRLQIGSQVNTGYLNGHIRRIAYYPVRLSNDQLQALTR